MRHAPGLGVSVFLLMAATVLHAEPPPAKEAVPEGAAFRETLSAVNAAFKTDIAAAETPEQKEALARKFRTAADSAAGARRYILLSKARDLAVALGEVDGCDAALDGIEARFDVDRMKVRLDAYAAVARNIHTYGDRRILGIDLSAMVHAALAADRFDAARGGASGCRQRESANDPELTQLAATDLPLASARGVAYEGIKKSLAALAAKPGDPDANLKVGRYRCFIEGDWKKGLPMLALGSDAALKALAQAEIAGAATADEQVKLGDGWWNASQKEGGLAVQQLQQHAATWYAAAAPGLAGLAKARVEQRVASLGAQRVALAFAKPKVVNLLASVDAAADAVRGSWVMKEGVLQSDMTPESRVQLRYDPPAEYDFRIEFSRDRGNDAVAMILVASGKQFAYWMGGWENTALGFEYIGNAGFGDGKTSVHAKSVFDNGKRYEALLKVRKTGVQAFIDGKLINDRKTDYADVTLSSQYPLPDTSALGVLTYRSSARFFKAQVIEITGDGTVTQGSKMP